jgi:hypothetical protein
MRYQRQQLIERLQGDEDLLALLPKNKPFWSTDLDEERMYSIIPADKVWDGIKGPFVTVQMSTSNLVSTRLTDAFVYVRCYNDGGKTFVAIDDVLSRVKALLHSHRFAQNADNAISIDTVYESTSSELVDEAYGLNYRESRYRLLYL